MSAYFCVYFCSFLPHMKTPNVKQITEDAIVSITAAHWAASGRHVQAVGKSYLEPNIAVEEEIEKCFIAVMSSDENTYEGCPESP